MQQFLELPKVLSFKLRPHRLGRRLRRSGTLVLGLSLLTLCTSCAHRGPFNVGAAVELGKLQAGVSEYPFKRPKGSHHYRLIVVSAKPDVERLRRALKGKAVIKRDGQTVWELEFSPEALRECPWFEEGRKWVWGAYFLHDPTTLDQSIKEKGEYVLVITLYEEPPSGSTVWLFYLPWYFGYL